MSAINGAGQGLFQFLQNLSGNSQSLSTTPSSATDAANATGTENAQVSGHHHHHGGGGADFAKIEQAVTSALQSASTSGTSTDANQTIENAIAQVFGNNNAAATTTTATAAGIPAATDPSGDGDTDAPGSTDADNTARQSFFATLQSFGVDPQQFRQDLLAAVQNAQGGAVDPSTAFQSFPPGAAVDANG